MNNFYGDILSTMKALLLEADWVPRPGYKPTSEEERTHRTFNSAKVWKNPRLKLVSIPKPRPGPKEVLVRVKASGICGSDVHMAQPDREGYMLYPGLTKLPVVLGHEFSGIVEEVGSSVQQFKPGDPVTAEEMWWCGECLYCRGGMVNQCANLEEMGFTVNGTHAEYVVIPEKYLWSIESILEATRGNEEKMFEMGATVEPTSVAYNAMFVRAGGFALGGYVAIYGAGPIGLAATALAKAAGASKVIVFDLIEERLAIAKEMGADYIFNVKELEKKGIKPSEKVLEITNGYGADLQVEAAGAPDILLPEIEKSMAVGGKITWIGRADKVAPIYLEKFQIRAAQIYGAQGHSGNFIFFNVIRLMAAGKIDTTKMITARYKLENYEEAFKELMHYKRHAKIQFKP